LQQIQALRQELKKASTIETENFESWADAVYIANNKIRRVQEQILTLSVAHPSSLALIDVLVEYCKSCIALNELYMSEYE